LGCPRLAPDRRSRVDGISTDQQQHRSTTAPINNSTDQQQHRSTTAPINNSTDQQL